MSKLVSIVVLDGLLPFGRTGGNTPQRNLPPEDIPGTNSSRHSPTPKNPSSHNK